MVSIVFVAATVVLFVAGFFYASRVSRWLGVDPSRPTPAVTVNDGRDYVPTPTGVVFAHHFASIAGAGPIIGPVIALAYGWLPALLWLVVGVIFFGAMHDFGALYVSMREGGKSLATVVRDLLGKPAFVLVITFTIIMLVLVTATFLNISATALTSKLAASTLGIAEGQTLLREQTIDGVRHVVIGGIASTSVIVITLLAPLVGYLYLKRNVAVWKCSIIAIVIAAGSLVAGLYVPVSLPTDLWKALLSAYVLVACGIPVWILLQPRDFVNVHLLYAGLALLAVLGLALGIGGSSFQFPALDIAGGTAKQGPLWPMLFILVACGAISGFHALCAGGTTCKQIKSEADARRVGYFGMLLESFLAIGVVCVVASGVGYDAYVGVMYPAVGNANPNLAFALGLGGATQKAFGLTSGAVGAIFAMLLLEGFVVTTLDTAVRLNRYLLEELWATMFRKVPKLLGHYWVNSGIAVALMLIMSYQGGVVTLWKLFGAGNQLLASIGLFTIAVWLAAKGRQWLFAIVPAVLMVVTTSYALTRALFLEYLDGTSKTYSVTLAVSDGVVLVLGLAFVIIALVRLIRGAAPAGGNGVPPAAADAQPAA